MKIQVKLFLSVIKNYSKALDINIYILYNSIVSPFLFELKRYNSNLIIGDNLQKSIAVLPFMNMSNDREIEYFSDGITEEIINALAKIDDLKVTSRTSSFFYKNKNIPINQIGENLGVSAILEGSVRLSSNKMRITAQLLQAENDYHFWSETWDRELSDIFEVQDEISLLIADKLREQFGHFEIQDHLVEKQTDDLTAYEYSLKARSHFNNWNPEDVKIAITLFEKAIELDNSHSESYLGLADCYGFLATTGFMPYDEAWEKAIHLTNKALLLNDKLAETYYQLANISFFVNSNYAEAYRNTQRAIELQKSNVEAQQFMSFLYIIAGNSEKSLEHLQVALSIDPLSQETLFYSAFYNFMTEDFQRSITQLDKCIEYNPKNIPAHSVKCYCLIKLGRTKDAIDYFDKNVSPEIVVPGDKIGMTALAYVVDKDFQKAQNLIEQLNQDSEDPGNLRTNLFMYLMHAIKGDVKNALKWANMAIETNSSLLFLHFANPLTNPIKNDSEYIKFQKKLFPLSVANSVPKKKKELLDENSIGNYKKQLLDYINKKKPYLDPKLSLRSLATQINIHPNQLSWLLNETIGKSYNDFINHYRVETFKQIAQNPQNAHISLIGLAYDSGFNSKTVFNTYFKKETGLTPKQFLQQTN